MVASSLGKVLIGFDTHAFVYTLLKNAQLHLLDVERTLVDASRHLTKDVLRNMYVSIAIFGCPLCSMVERKDHRWLDCLSEWHTRTVCMGNSNQTVAVPHFGLLITDGVEG